MYIYHLKMTMLLDFTWEHVAELQVQHRHAQQLAGAQLSAQRLFPPVWTTATVMATGRSGLKLQ